MLHAAGLPDRFWPFACQTAVYHQQPTAEQSDQATPRHTSSGTASVHISVIIRTFGCLAYALVHQSGQARKSEQTRCTFVGYPLDASRTYLLWDNQQHKLTPLRPRPLRGEHQSGGTTTLELTVTAGEATASSRGGSSRGGSRSAEALIESCTVIQAMPLPSLLSYQSTSARSTTFE